MESGYTFDPGWRWAHYYTDAVPFEQINGIPCLALLGEPGLGKSTTMEVQRQQIMSEVVGTDASVLWYDLKEFGTEDRLLNAIFKSPEFLAWAQHKHQLHIYLDSLDECQIRVGNLANVLAAELSRYQPLTNLFLRLACRTAEWPTSLEDSLRTFWKEEEVGVYELTPLTRSDIEAAVIQNGIDVDIFLDEIERTGSAALAIKPVTLQFLINTFLENEHFPLSQVELYEKGCLLLCQELNKSRRDSKDQRLTGFYSAEKRMEAAMVIAATMVFTGRTAIWTEPDFGNVPETDITFHVLAQYSAMGLRLDERLIYETLDTGLFSGREAGRFGWAHQTYGEFLAAWFVHKHSMSLEQITSLIVHPDTREKSIVPQLHEVTAWLASLDQRVFEEILQTDPEILIRSDVSNSTPSARFQLLERLLSLYDERKLLTRPWNYRIYRRLDHPYISDQLRRYISIKERNIVARREAIVIAEACKIKELQDVLLDIVLDESEGDLRIFALSTLEDVADEETKLRLKPFALGIESDTSDELKGIALKLTWPKYIGVEELFSALTPPKDDHVVGQYTQFLSSNPVQHLSIEHLPIALRWVSNQPSTRPYRSSFQELINQIFWKGWENLEAPGVLDGFAHAALSRLSEHIEIVEERDAFDRFSEQKDKTSFRDLLLNENEKRHKVLIACLPLITDPTDIVYLIWTQTPLCIRSDFAWLLSCYSDPSFRHLKLHFELLIDRLFHAYNSEHLEAILSIEHKLPDLYQKYRHCLIVDLNSNEADQWKSRYEEDLKRTQEELEIERKSEQRRLDIVNRIAEALVNMKRGDTNAWISLYFYSIQDQRNQRLPIPARELDITNTVTWIEADFAAQSDIVAGAKTYILEHLPATEEWVEALYTDGTYFYAAYAGLSALYLILKTEPEFLSSLNPSIYQAWAPIVVAYPVTLSSEDQAIVNVLACLCYQIAPDEVIATLLRSIEVQNRGTGSLYRIDFLDLCWDTRLSDSLLDLLYKGILTASSTQVLLLMLIKHNVSEAREYAESLIYPPYNDEEALKKGVVAASILFRKTDDAGWNVVWPALRNDESFAEEVLAVLTDFEWRNSQLGHQLDEGQLGELYAWLVHQYPPSEDPQHKGGYTPTPRDKIGDWRKSIPGLLSRKGTHRSIEVLTSLVQQFSEIDSLVYALSTARETVRRLTWLPPQPRDIYALASNQDNRLVQNGDQLLTLLINSLRTLEDLLQGETPASIFLWDAVSSGKTRTKHHRPKDEEAFSDFIKLHLQSTLESRGIIINREVVIRRGTGDGPGERTDIHVDAVNKKPYQDSFTTLKTIVEVKGIWNPQVNIAMKTQLLDRYLQENSCQFGLYIVGWFNCIQWDETDKRKKQASTRFNDIHEAQTYFDRQAQELSKGAVMIRAIVLNASLR